MVVTAAEADVLARLRAGDQAAFRDLVRKNHAAMVRFATGFVPSTAVAEEVVQDTWIAVIRGIGGFEGRSTLRTWMFRILANQARTRGVRERRTVPASSLTDELADAEQQPSVAVERFAGPAGRGVWAQPPARWSDQPEERLLIGATFERFAETVTTLPENQRRVLVLRDVEGWTSEEVCELLELSEVNQRVLLHRARSRLRATLEQELGGPR
jgi:RNA polymerase sigma-70 factor (ECF subfamily)